jgi:hypothetical protein
MLVCMVRLCLILDECCWVQEGVVMLRCHGQFCPWRGFVPVQTSRGTERWCVKLDISLHGESNQPQDP